QLAFDQPDIAVLYFPFVLLPGVVVPVVLLSHLAAIRQLLVKRSYSKIIALNTDHTLTTSASLSETY
ncbi:MAG TPA: hypothetical protein VM010_02440, partial [Chitinophagaceae bacterium]|nr:hypothetical protein [Chitinophagaceae bacterium]